ncbi:hypothetical protein M514_06183 [Trichuris suis]|uniref:Uncharacterized protein n=1 Tax=Trichuris suis TaxID=68888 RepID=A0A085NFG1_9BILA|nr:hypothetical protein M513_06183 [Trichuris suis]KFD68207.1 hypothetical protein M514_06183 [Trichuris suis]
MDEGDLEEWMNVDNALATGRHYSDSEIVQVVVYQDKEDSGEERCCNENEEDTGERISIHRLIKITSELLKGLEQRSFITEQEECYQKNSAYLGENGVALSFHGFLPFLCACKKSEQTPYQRMDEQVIREFTENNARSFLFLEHGHRFGAEGVCCDGFPRFENAVVYGSFGTSPPYRQECPSDEDSVRECFRWFVLIEARGSALPVIVKAPLFIVYDNPVQKMLFSVKQHQVEASVNPFLSFSVNSREIIAVALFFASLPKHSDPDFGEELMH